MEIKPMPPKPEEWDGVGHVFYDNAHLAHWQSRAQAAEKILASIFDKAVCTCRYCIEPDRNNYEQLKRSIVASESGATRDAGN